MIKIFGERVAVTEMEEQIETTLALPQQVNKTFNLGKVVSVGDGVTRQARMEMVVKEKDNIVFQMNSVQAANCLHYVKGKPVFILNQGDCIGRIKGRVMKLEEFEILGPWCLVKLYIEAPHSGLHLPDTIDVSASELQKYRLVQKGNLVKLDIVPGQEVFPERMMVTRIDIGGATYGFVMADRLAGVLDGGVD